MSDDRAGDEKWARLSRREAFRCPYYRISHDRYRLPDGSVGDYCYVDTPGATMVIAEADDGRLAVIRQHRYLFARPSLEFPGGGIVAGQSALQSAQRELEEEAGYRAERWTRLASVAPYKGISNELTELFVARQLTAVDNAPEPTEEFEQLLLTPAELFEAIDAGELWDGQTIAALALYQRRHGG